MAENVNNYGGVGTVTVTAVNSLPPTYVPASAVDGGSIGQVKITPSPPSVGFRTSNNTVAVSGDPSIVPTHYPMHADICNSTGMTDGMTGMVQSTGGIIGDGVNAGTLPVTASVKKTSFQITSVTVDSSASNDGGDDSADDLDESHTEDSSDVATDISRHTSESRGGSAHTATDDNFTRNDIFYNPAPPSSMNIAPVIPTSSQYGLAIVPEGINPVSEPPPPAPVAVNDTASEKPDPDKDIVHNRFKVVKIVSTEPFKKGRWMCMDYFDHTTTTTGTTTTLKDTTTPQPQQQQPIPQSQTHGNIPQPMQPVSEKLPVNVVNVQQGSNVPLTSSPPQPGHPGINNSNILPDSQHTTMIQQQTQSSQHVMQQQLQQGTMSDQDGSINTNGLPNGNGTHYHVSHSHNVQGVNLSQVAPVSNVINTNASDPSAFGAPIPNHNPAMSSSGNTYQSSIGQQQQQQQYYNNTGVLAGIPPRPVSVAPTSNIPAQQPSIGSQQQPMGSQQQPRPIAGQVPLVQGEFQPQTLGQIGPQSSISQNTSVPILSQAMSTTQMHQAPVQVTQPSHLPAQSLPHGAHAQMTASASISSTAPTAGSTGQQQQQQQQQQQHTAQSLGHNMLQQNKPPFMNAQSQTQTPNQYQQQPNAQPQQLIAAAQQTVIGSQNSNQQGPQVGQMSQAPQAQQQQQQQNYQAGMMMQNIPGLQQQVHVQQMNPAGVSQHSVQMQPQPSGQNQGIYTTPGQMMGHTMQMSGQAMNMQQTAQPIMQQPNVIPNQQTMMQQQPHIVGQQQHHQQMMGMPPPQPMVSQPQTSAPQQNIMSQQPMMSQMIQNTQMSGMVNQPPLVSQPGVMPQQQGIMPAQANLQQQQNLMQQIPQQATYPQQAQQQTINNQAAMQQPLMQQYPQQQPNPVVQQQQMMPPQSQSNIMAQQMGQTMTQGQQQQMPMQQQQSQPSQQQQQQAQQQQQQTFEVNMQPQPQQNVYQNPPQQMQVSQANVPNMTNMQAVHNIMPPSSQSIPQMGTQMTAPAGLQLQGSNIVENEYVSNSLSTSEPSATQQQQQQQQQQPIVQQQNPVPVPTGNQVQPAPPAVPSPADVHMSTQNPPSATQVPPVVTTTLTAVPSSAITSLSAAATVIIDGVNSLAEAAVGGGGTGANEDGESATGTNTVAIDNKIEQAMDLVKSHLMFAVREEVEVLKEKISELMERITQLEYENSILRANASQETLAQLQKSTQHPAPNVNEGHQGFS